MNCLVRLLVCGVVSASFVSNGFSQTIGPDAGAKIRGEVTSSASHNAYAQQQARVMYYYQQITPAAKPEVVKQQAETVKSALAKADEELKAIKAAHPKDAEVIKLVDSILKHHAAATSHCSMAAECAVKGEGVEKTAECCVEMHDELEAANKDYAALKKYLKIEELPVPKKAPKK